MNGVKVTLGNRNDGGGCASMHERSERVESPGTYVTLSFTLPFLLGPVFFRTALSCSGIFFIWRGVGCRYMPRLG